MTSVQSMGAALAELVARTGDLAPAILFFASFVEYVFPPFPGDLVVVLGAWYSVHGSVAWPITFVSVTAGAMAGAWVDYRIGAALGRRIDARAAARHVALAVRLARFEASYRRWGAWLLVWNRFMPGLRAFVFLAAGASHIPLRRVMLLGGLSAALWNAVLLAAGALVARNVDELVGLVDRYTTAAWGVLGAIALLAGAVALWRRRAARAAGGPGTPPSAAR